MFKKLRKKVVLKLKEQKGDLVGYIVIAVMVGIIAVGSVTALKPNIQTAQSKTNTMLQSAGSSFSY